MTLRPRSSLTEAKYRQNLPSSPRFIVLDLETTGFSPYTDRIIEIGALELINLETVRIFHSLAQPSQALSARITELTGISPNDLEGKPTPAEALREFIAWMGPQEDVTLVGHNIGFDMSFLERELDRGNSSDALVLTRNTFCTYNFIKLAFFGRQLDLERACRLFTGQKDKAEARHRALGDCELTQKLLVALVNWAIFIDSPGLPVTPFAEESEDSPLQHKERRLPWGNSK
jgi:DNA polymerase-3 subunit alpha (Gram-positive type)